MSDHLKREINDERMPGEDAFKAFVRTGPKPDWQKALAKESILIPKILRDQRTLRLAKLVPLWSIYAETEDGWRAKKSMDATDWRKFRAWWELLLAVQRWPDDQAAVSLAILFIAREVTGVRNRIKINAAQIDAAHALLVEEEVRKRIKDLHPVEVAPGADVQALTRPKYEKQ